MYEIELYRTQSGRSPVEEYMKELTDKNKILEIAKIENYEKRLKEYGMTVNNSYPETIRKLRDDIYELRPGNNRIFFFYYTGEKFVLLHAYRKHSKKAPPSEIENAIKEMKDYKRRNQNG